MKKLFVLFLSVVFLISLPTTAYAHSGGTDSNGGHTNHSTGEYHYHHGYPAHDHYDMDGDGDIDCPYDFDDKTGSDSGSSSSYNSGSTSCSNRSYSLPTLYLPELTLPTSTPSVMTTIKPLVTPQPAEKETEEVPLWSIRVIVLLSLAVLFLLFRNRVKTVDFQKQKVSYEKNLKDNNLRHQQELETQKHQYEKRLKTDVAQVEQDLCVITDAMHRVAGDKYLYKLAGAPSGEMLDSNNLPFDTNTTADYWGQKYTLYTSASPNFPIRYHDSWCRYANISHPINAHKINLNPKRYTPCAICCPKLPDTAWVTRYLLYKSIVEKHQSDTITP